MGGFVKFTPSFVWSSLSCKQRPKGLYLAGNLLKLIELGRGARQGDPIASILFVLAIEILLIAIRTNDNIEPYTFQLNFNTTLKHKVEAYADDVNLSL